MARRFDVVVVGAGVMGAATARSIARSGRTVALLEQFAIGHTRGSSHGGSRIFRFSYPEPEYVEMARAALGLWRELEAEAGRELITVTGGLDFGKDLDRHLAALERCGAPFEVLTGDEVNRRWPAVAIASSERALFQPNGGIARARDAWAALAGSAARHGAEVIERAPVTHLVDGPDSVEIDTPAGILSASVAVVTAGAWARPLLATCGLDLPTIPTRETVTYFATQDGAPIPSVVEWDDPAVYALASPAEGGFEVKVGEHHAGPVTDPDQEGVPDSASVERIARWVARRCPGAHPIPLRSETCLYTNTA
ncbi:MAG: FAD-dependent oxidoreductase, partial [Actinomycetota bacterium]|nr:FAD-dependent oxidoreductase [Actinomycetota bacterium]